MKYNNETFHQYCEENHVITIDDYTNIIQDSPVEGRCPTKGCKNIFNKSFRSSFVVEHIVKNVLQKGV
jgi:hypothetical protein